MANGVPTRKRKSRFSRSSVTAVDRAVEALERRTLFANINWIAVTSGDFNDPANWDSGTVPGPGDNVTVFVSSQTDVVMVTTPESIASLTLESPLTISSPTAGSASLKVAGPVSVTGTTLQIGSADAVSSGQLIIVGSNSISGNNSGFIQFAGTAGNPNQIDLVDASAGDQSQLAISGVTIDGSSGSIGALSSDGSIFNEGATIESDGGGKIAIQAGATGTFFNNGTIGASSGDLDLEGAWSNEDALQVSTGGTLNLGGTFTNNDVNSISNSGGTVNITGMLFVDGSLNLSATTGSFFLEGGSIMPSDGNNIEASSGVALVLTAAGGTLDQVTLGEGTPLDASAGSATIEAGLMLEGTTLPLGGVLSFSGSQTITGGGNINFTGGGGGLEAVGDGGANPATLTINSGLVIQGASGTIAGMNAGDSIFSEAIIDANAAGTGINIHGGTLGNFTNSGPVTAEGGTLNITGEFVNETEISVTAGATLNLGDQNPGTTNLWTNSGVINADSSTVNIGGDLVQSALGAFNRTGGTVNLTGMYVLQGSTQTFDATSGDWNLEGGTVDGTNSTIDTNGNALILTAAGGTLTGGLTLGPGSPVDASAGTATIIGGVTLTGTTLHVGSALIFSGSQTIAGTGSIILQGGKLEALGDARDGAATLTVGSGISVVGQTGTIAGVTTGDSIVNDGILSATGSALTLSLSTDGGTITNAGTLQVSPLAAIAVTGNLTTTATSVIAEGIDATGAGTLDVTGTATLNGTLDIGVSDGFVPPQGMVYSVLDFGTSTGTFATINGLTPAGAVLTPATATTSFTLTTTAGSVGGLLSTTLTAVSSEPVATAGDSITFIATVASSAASADGSVGNANAPTGTVSFLSSGITFGTATVQADGTATVTLSTLPVGRLMVTAVYSGDTIYASSSSAVLGETISSPVETIGGLSPTYGSQGLAAHAVGFTATSGVAVAASGQSIVAGTIGTAPSESFGITRYNADGTLDTTFGTGGVASYTFGSTDDRVASILVLPGGQLLVSGTATTYIAGVASGSQFALAEFNADGTLDTAFGGGSGEVLTSFSTNAGVLSNDVVHAMVISNAGTIYLGGSTDAGGHGQDFAIAAYTAAGLPAGGFNGTGKVELDFAGGDDSINSLAVQINGAVVAAGVATVSGTAQIALARFLPTGILDKRFGTLGTVTTNVRGVYDSAASVVIQPKGQIIIGGVSATGSGSSLSADFVLVRYTAAGKIDNTFGGGPVITSFGQPSAVTQLVLLDNGTILASGKTTASLTSVNPNALDVALARYTATGALDTTFNATGKTIIHFTSAVTTTGSHTSFFSEMLIEPLDATSLGTAFNQFISSQQGVVATTTGGAILAAGSSGANTVEAQIIVAGVDLIASVLSALPASVPGGLKGTAIISVGENGTTLAKGTVTIELQFATDAAGDGAATVKSFAEKINLRQGATHPFKLAFVFPANITADNYFLLATVTDGAPLTDLNVNNNTGLSTHTVDISPPATMLAGSGLAATTTLVPGKSGGVEFTLTNNGNILAHGKIVVDLYISADQVTADGTLIPTTPLVVSLAPGKSHLYRLRGVLPAAATAGSYDLLALIDPSNSLGATDHSDVLATGTAMVT